MRRLFWFALFGCGWLFDVACQPIAIGIPAQAGGQAAGLAGSADGMSPSGDSAGDASGDANDRGSNGGAAGSANAGVAGNAESGGPGLGGEPGGGQAGAYGGAPPADPCSLTVQGRIKVPRGAAVVGMDVSLSGQADASTKTGIDGDYVFAKLCPGRYAITPSCGASAVQLDLATNQTLDFTNTAGGCDADAVEPRVLIVIFDPTATPADVSPPRRLSAVLGLGAPADAFALQMMDAVTGATNGHVRPNGRRVTGSLDFPQLLGGFRYTPESFAACLKDANRCSKDAIDYEAADRELGLCELVQSENIDQIWVYGADKLNMPRVGALSCQLWVTGSLTTQVLDVFGLRYDRGLSSFLSDFQAAADAELWSVFPNVPGDPVTNPYGLFLQACGSVQRAPNSEQADVFDGVAAVPSYCDAFLDYPLSPPLPLESLSCSAWGCTEDGFRRYWFSRLPRARWSDAAGRYNDFWRSVLTNRHAALADVDVTCSSSAERGACQHVSDGQYGSCGVGEWALQDEASGWVEYRFSSPRWLSGLALYDRACDDRVLAGHVEFSDGSAPVSFAALEPSGVDGTGLVFPPKLLTGLRVYIDQSSGASPGFGELSLTFAAPVLERRGAQLAVGK